MSIERCDGGRLMPGSKLKVHAMPSLICFVLAFSTGEQSRPELAGFARLPAETFAEGPPSGAFDREGVRLAAPRFPSQVVQGFSGVQFGSECNNYWVIATAIPPISTCTSHSRT